MPFTSLKLHPSLLKGVKELGFARPTPIQADAMPPALAGRDVLACAMTGSGKTAAFVLPILHRLIDKPRGTTRALILTPTRELAAQIVEDLQDLAVHTPVTAAPVFGGVGMGPQEHAFRSGVDIIVATPGRLLDHFSQPYARLSRLEILVLDEADRMLDMGFLPEIRKVLRHLPAKRQTLFFSATMPPPILALTRDMLRNPVTINLERRAAPAVGITQAVYPVPQELKSALFLALLRRGDMREALVFTRTKHRTDRLAEVPGAERHRGRADPREPVAGAAHPGAGRVQERASTACSWRRTSPRAGIDIEALGHVVNFDVPKVPEDYIHRVGRTARAEADGRRVHVRGAGGGARSPADRARPRPAAAARPAAGFRLCGEAGGDAWRCRSASGSPRSGRRRGRGEVKPGAHRAHSCGPPSARHADRHFLRVPSPSPRASCPPVITG